MHVLWANTKHFPCAVIVRYPREPVTQTEGHSLSFKCTVEYRKEDCDIEAKWWYTKSSESLPIMDPNTYLITVNETELEKDNLKLRDIFLTIGSLKLQDSGFYQCDATCLDSGTQAKGHLLFLNVTGLSWKNNKIILILRFRGVMHSLFLRGHELGWGGRHMTHQPRKHLCFILYLFYFIWNIPKRINYIMKYPDSHLYRLCNLLIMHKNLSVYLSNRHGCHAITYFFLIRLTLYLMWILKDIVSSDERFRQKEVLRSNHAGCDCIKYRKY